MIKNIIFDIGRVLLEFEPIQYMEEKYKNSELYKELFEIIFKSPEWIELDRGTITDKDAMQIFSKRCPQYKEFITDIMKDWNNILKPIDDTIEILNKLKNNGYKIYLLSNFHNSAFEKVYEKYPFFKLADGMAISSKIKLIKPDKEIYEYLSNTFLLKPSESLFVDDTLINIEAADNLGFNTIVFQNPQQLDNQLKKLRLL